MLKISALCSVALACALPLGFAFLVPAAAQQQASPLLPPDPRYKADLLLIVAHPDDDVVIGGYLARIALDEHKRVAVVYCTRGDGGGNSVGNEAGAALGLIREMEARRALATFGTENVWFLNGHDTPGQNVLRSLDNWNHGLMLDEIVRLVRITQPEVILTWLPDPVAGENHEDHQAAGVLAVEAFDAAGDPTRFPAQVSPARDRNGMANLTEGLETWQPRKLYFFTDAFEDFGPYWHDSADLPPYRKSIVDGTGPSYDTTTISPARHKTYAQLTAEMQSVYQTQEGSIGDKALKTGHLADFEYPTHLILGKSLAGGSIAADVFEGIQPGSISFARVRGFEPENQSGLSFEIGDPWRFYSLFWKAHNLDNLAGLIPAPETAVDFGGKLNINLLVCNHTSQPAEISIASALPAGWTDKTQFTHYPVQPGECYPLQSNLDAPSSGKASWQQLDWTATANSQPIGHVAMHVLVGKSGGLPQ